MISDGLEIILLMNAISALLSQHNHEFDGRLFMQSCSYGVCTKLGKKSEMMRIKIVLLWA